MITLWIPESESSTFEQNIVSNGGAKNIRYQARMHNGHRVIDVPPGFFKTLLASPNGMLWQKLNPRALDWIGEMSGSNQYQGQPFPDENNPPPVAPAVVTEVAPTMVTMTPPDGCSSFSHEGVSYQIGKRRTIEVTEKTAEALRSHGFR